MKKTTSPSLISSKWRRWHILLVVFLLFFGEVGRGYAQQYNCTSLLAKADSIYFSNPDSSYTLSCLAEECAKKTNNITTIAKAYLSKSKYLLLKSDLEEATVQINKSLTYYKEASDWKGLAHASKLKAILEKRLGNIHESMLYTEEAVRLSKKIDEIKGIISGLLNLSLDYIDDKQYDKAGVALGEIESYQEQLSVSDMYYYYQNKGKLKLALNKYPAAITDFSKALEVAETKQMIDSKATILMFIAKAYRLNRQYEWADYYIKQSEDVSETNKLDHELSDAYTELILLQKDLGNYKEAFQYLLLQNSLNEKMVNIEKINHISMLEKKLALSEKQKEIEQEKLKTQQTKQNSEQLMYLVVGVTLVAIFAIFMFIRTRTLNRRIAIQNKKLEYKNKVIEEQKEAVDKAYKKLHEEHEEIQASIRYAKRIQDAFMTPLSYINRELNRLLGGSKPKE